MGGMEGKGEWGGNEGRGEGGRMTYRVSHRRPSVAVCFFALSSFRQRDWIVVESRGEASWRSRSFCCNAHQLSALAAIHKTSEELVLDEWSCSGEIVEV